MQSRKLEKELRKWLYQKEQWEKKTGKSPIITEDGDDAPYNGEPEYSINTEKAASLGYRFSNLSDWIYDLVDYYIAELFNKL